METGFSVFRYTLFNILAIRYHNSWRSLSDSRYIAGICNRDSLHVCWSYHTFHIRSVIPIYCITIQIRKVWNFINNPRFLIHRSDWKIIVVVFRFYILGLNFFKSLKVINGFRFIFVLTTFLFWTLGNLGFVFILDFEFEIFIFTK